MTRVQFPDAELFFFLANVYCPLPHPVIQEGKAANLYSKRANPSMIGNNGSCSIVGGSDLVALQFTAPIHGM